MSNGKRNRTTLSLLVAFLIKLSIKRDQVSTINYAILNNNETCLLWKVYHCLTAKCKVRYITVSQLSA